MDSCKEIVTHLLDFITDIPVAKILEQSEGYRMGEPGQNDVSRTHSLLV